MTTPTSPNTRGTRSAIARALATATLAASVVACSQDMSDLEQFVEETKQAQRRTIEPLPEIEPHETFKYEAASLRDPFEPLAFSRPEPSGERQQTGTGLQPDESRPKEPLESYPLDALRMVGTLDQGGAEWALIRASDGTIHRVTVGNYMGQNHGKIIQISENEVQLMEIVPDGLGGYVERQASLALTE